MDPPDGLKWHYCSQLLSKKLFRMQKHNLGLCYKPKSRPTGKKTLPVTFKCGFERGQRAGRIPKQFSSGLRCSHTSIKALLCLCHQSSGDHLPARWATSAVLTFWELGLTLKVTAGPTTLRKTHKHTLQETHQTWEPHLFFSRAVLVKAQAYAGERWGSFRPLKSPSKEDHLVHLNPMCAATFNHAGKRRERVISRRILRRDAPLAAACSMIHLHLDSRRVWLWLLLKNRGWQKWAQRGREEKGRRGSFLYVFVTEGAEVEKLGGQRRSLQMWLTFCSSCSNSD